MNVSFWVGTKWNTAVSKQTASQTHTQLETTKQSLLRNGFFTSSHCPSRALCRIKLLPVHTCFWWDTWMLTVKPVYKLLNVVWWPEMDYKHTCDTIFTHFPGITNNIYGFGRPFFTRPQPVHHISTRPYSFFTRPNDGWTGLYIKLCCHPIVLLEGQVVKIWPGLFWVVSSNAPLPTAWGTSTCKRTSSLPTNPLSEQLHFTCLLNVSMYVTLYM